MEINEKSLNSMTIYEMQKLLSAITIEMKKRVNEQPRINTISIDLFGNTNYKKKQDALAACSDYIDSILMGEHKPIMCICLKKIPLSEYDGKPNIWKE